MKDVYYTPNDTKQEELIKSVDNIKADRTSLDLLFQVMLDLGILLSSKIETIAIDNKLVFNIENNFLIACFDENITEEIIKAIAKKKPHYFVLKDSCISNDNLALNFDQIFQSFSPDTIKKVL